MHRTSPLANTCGLSQNEIPQVMAGAGRRAAVTKSWPRQQRPTRSKEPPDGGLHASPDPPTAFTKQGRAGQSGVPLPAVRIKITPVARVKRAPVKRRPPVACAWFGSGSPPDDKPRAAPPSKAPATLVKDRQAHAASHGSARVVTLASSVHPRSSTQSNAQKPGATRQRHPRFPSHKQFNVRPQPC